MKELPRICYFLGGEKTPLKIGEDFNSGEYKCFISEDGNIVCTNFLSVSVLPDWVLEMFNHPENIIRRPQFSEDEKALMRLFVKAGYPLFLPAVSGEIVAWSKDGIHGNAIQKGILSQITDRLDAAAYLESEESK